MASDRTWKRSHPKVLVEQACVEFGDEMVISWCIELVAGRASSTDENWPSIDHLGGAPDWPAYWARVWGARAMLYCWDPRAADTLIDTLIAALADDHWRVREMAVKVIAHREVGQAADAVAARVRDDVPRVRAAAVRALGIIGEGEHAKVLDRTLDDVDPAVARAAASALDTLAERLDRPL